MGADRRLSSAAVPDDTAPNRGSWPWHSAVSSGVAPDVAAQQPVVRDAIRRLELEPVEGTPVALRARLAEPLPVRWFEVVPVSKADRGHRWFWIGREDALDGARAAHVLLLEIGPRLRVTNVIGAGDGPDLDILFVTAANRTTGSGHPADAERWNDFLVAALPVPDGTGFADVLRAVLVSNGWPDESADRLAVQAEQANELLSAYRAAHG